MPLRIACVSGKGGVGKTTTCASLAGALAERGLAVLAADMDPQANLTAGLGFDPYSIPRTVYELLVDTSLRPADVILPTRWASLRLLPANPDLSAVEDELPSAVGRELRLRDALDRGGGLEGVDALLVDTPPNFGFHTISVLAAVDWVLVPVQMSGYAIKGLKEVLRTLHTARQQLNPTLRLLGLVPTFVNMRTRFSRDIVEGLREIPNLHVFDTMVAMTVKLQETALVGVPITQYAPLSGAAVSYRQLADEVLARVEAVGMEAVAATSPP